MKRLNLLTPLTAILSVLSSPLATAQNSTFFNPTLPGWHSDPSCVRVNETFFCATSTFISFPGLPVYASTDLQNWRLISHAWNRESQLPGISWNTYGQQDGMYAPTLRYHDGEYWLVCEYLGIPGGIIGVLFRTKNPFDENGWSDPLIFRPQNIDPDLFWDDDGKLYVATHGILLQELDLETGELSQPPLQIWPGTGGVWPEGPHIYKRDGWYYLLIAEGGTGTDHAITIARSRNVTGPYEGYEGNPILTNRGTDSYFQTVGHGDLFTDTDGNWWGMALATRSGPEYQHYPMGREAVLFAATWEEGEWPVLQPVSGRNTGWALPPLNPDVPGDGPLNDAADEYDLDSADESLPKHWVYWRVPREGAFTTTDSGLEIIPSRNNLTGDSFSEDVYITGRQGLSFIGRRQAHTLFDFSVDIDFAPDQVGQEAGLTVFLTQVNHIDISVIFTDDDEGESEPALHFRSNAVGQVETPEPHLIPVPRNWTSPYTLHIQAKSPELYSLYASHDGGCKLELGTASSSIVSGGNGSFVGSLVGAFSTCNGAGQEADCPDGAVPKFLNWRYTPVAQYISADELIDAGSRV